MQLPLRVGFSASALVCDMHDSSCISTAEDYTATYQGLVLFWYGHACVGMQCTPQVTADHTPAIDRLLVMPQPDEAITMSCLLLLWSAVRTV